MALQKTLSLLLLLLLTLLGLGLVQPSYGQSMHQRFKQQHVDAKHKGGTSSYCDMVMKTRRMARPKCKQFNTFIHADIGAISKICKNLNIRCKNGKMNCHKGEMNVTECKLTGGSPGKCKYQGSDSYRDVVIACNGKPLVPVRLDE